MKKIIIAIMISICFFVFADTLAITENGETVVLHEDGTWEYLVLDPIEDWTNYVKYTEFKFKVRPLNELEIMDIEFCFENLTDKRILGIEFKVHFLDVFNEVISKQTFKVNISAKPKETFEILFDDTFLTAWLIDSAKNGTLHTIITVTRIAFNTDDILYFKENWIQPIADQK